MSSYIPADSGFPKYFFGMLDDKDRNSKYSDAIKACIEEFIKKEGREPTVLDIGIGTGMLSCLCIKHGAKHVTGVDTNPTMFTLAKRALAEVDPTGKKYKVKLVGVGPSQLDESEEFDMIVSEILGTLTTSESMFKYVSAYLGHLKIFGGGDEGEERVYVVPRTTTQFFSVVSYDRAEMGAPLASALEHAIHSSEASRKVRARREHTVSRARVDFSFPFRSFPPPFCLFVSSPHISHLSLSLFSTLCTRSSCRPTRAVSRFTCRSTMRRESERGFASTLRSTTLARLRTLRRARPKSHSRIHTSTTTADSR
jgi:SAM-dependent methyltransferase